MKFDPEGFWSTAFVKRWGYGVHFMYFIGACEFLGGIALLIPKVWKYGAALLAIVMLGALITRLVFGTSLDDVLSIAGNMFLLLFIAVFWGIGDDIARLRKQPMGK